MKTVEHDARIGQIAAHIADIRGRHVDAHRVNFALLAASDLIPKGFQRLGAFAIAHEKQLARIQIQYDRKIAMALAKGYFVDGYTLDALEARPPKAFKKGPFLNVLNRVPAEADNRRDILDGCGAQHKENILLQTFGVPLVQPRKRNFDPADEAAITARNPWNSPSNDDLFVSDGRCLKVPWAPSSTHNVCACCMPYSKAASLTQLPI